MAANIGSVVPVVGALTDLLYDAPRNLVYLANPTRNEVGIYSVAQARLVGSLYTGLQPATMALSPDGTKLYVANLGSLTVSAVDLATQRLVTDYYIGSRPDAIAVGSDGNIVILGTVGLLRLDPSTGTIQSVPISPPATPPAGVPPTPISPTPAGFLAGLRTAASGRLIIGLSTSRLFVYDVASGTVLRSRNVTGIQSIMSASPDGSRFMVGPFLFDTQTLTILGRAGATAGNLSGGTVFSNDGNTVYSSLSTHTQINPLNTNNPQNPGGAVIPGAIAGQPPATPTRAVLHLLRSSSLTMEMGLRLPEAISTKIISSADGQFLFANCTSGLLVIPIGQLSRLPVLDVSSTNVFLSVDMCNKRVVTASVQVRNAGSGRMTFSAALNNAGAPVVLNRNSGVAPASLDISFDPRSVTTRGTLQFTVVLVSQEAVNIEPAILVNLNYRDVSQRGATIPIPGVGVDMQVDSARQLLYIANYTRDQIEVFSLRNQSFLTPIRVGNRPRSIAMVGPDTLVVANSGAESMSVVDLASMQESEQILMAPIPLNAAPRFPLSVAASYNAILFSAIPLAAPGTAPGTGSVWQLSLATRSCFPRLDLGTGVANTVQGRNMLISPPDGSSILLVEGNGTIRLYDPLSDTFPISRAGAVGGLRGTAAVTADGSYFVVDNAIFNSVLVLQGILGGTGASAALGVGIAGNDAVRVQAPTPLVPIQSLQTYNVATLSAGLQFQLPEQIMDVSPAQTGTGARQWPPRAVALELGVNNQTQLLPRGAMLDGSGNAYLFTFSGLSIVSLRGSAGRAPSFQANGVVNAATRTAPISPGALISIRGSNLADEDKAGPGTPLPSSLGGVCVTANEVAIPLLGTSPTQIDAQLPPAIGTGRITLTVRSTRLGVASAGVAVQPRATSPGVFTVTDNDGQARAALFHEVDGMLVTSTYPAQPDESLILFVTGLGAVLPTVPAGTAGSLDPASATTQKVDVTIGGRAYSVTWSGLAAGEAGSEAKSVGVYQINLGVPVNRVRGDNLPVIVTVGGLSSPSANAPTTSIR